MAEQTLRYTGIHGRAHWLWLWAPVVVYCGMIFFASAQHDLAPPAFPSSDKVAHFVVYGGLGILWARAAKMTWPGKTFTWVWISTILFTGLYGVTDETHQLYVPGRFSDWRDAVADVCGGTMGGLSYLVGSLWLLRRTTRVDIASWNKAVGTTNAE